MRKSSGRSDDVGITALPIVEPMRRTLSVFDPSDLPDSISRPAAAIMIDHLEPKRRPRPSPPDFFAIGILDRGHDAAGLGRPAPQRDAARPVEVENVRVGFGPVEHVQDRHLDAGLGPAWRGARSGSPGFMDLVVPDDDGIPTSYRQPVELGRGRASGSPPMASRRARHRLHDPALRQPAAGGSLEVPQDIEHARAARRDHARRDVDPDPGPAQGVDQIPNLPGFASAVQGRRGDVGADVRSSSPGSTPQGGPHARPLVRLRRGPDDRARHRATPPCSSRSTRSAGRRWSTGSSTAATWSSRSGPTGRRSATACCGPILPALPAGQERVTSLEALDTFAGSIKPITPPGHAAGHGHEARGGRGARRQGASASWPACRWSSAGRTASAG